MSEPKNRMRVSTSVGHDTGSHASEALSDALDYFTETVCASKPAATRGSYEQKARHISRLLGAMQLADLTRSHVERYIANRIAEGAHTHCIHKELVVLRGALASAEARGLFHGVISKLVPKFQAKYVPRETYLTPEQFSRLLWNVVAPPHPNARPETVAKIERRRVNRTLYCMLIALASPRRGELEKLLWEHVDLVRSTIKVPKGKTKSRVVPIHPYLRPWLEALHKGTGPVIEPWGNDKRELARACARAGACLRASRRAPRDAERPAADVRHLAQAERRRLGRGRGHDGPQLHGDGRPRLRQARRSKLPPGDRKAAWRDASRPPGDRSGLSRRCHVTRAKRWQTWHLWHGRHAGAGHRS